MSLQEIDETVYRAENVLLHGKVAIGAHSSLWPHVVVRCEANHVRIGRYTNLQDFVMVHIGYDHPTEVGDFCSITHHATIHGCTIEDDCLIGINAVIMDGAVVGRGSIVAGGAVVGEGAVFPEHSIIAGVPAKRIRERDSSRANRLNAWLYHRNAVAYRQGNHRVWEGEIHQRWLSEKRTEIETDRDLELAGIQR